IYNSQVFDNGTNIGIGTTTPAATAKIHINQNSASVLEHMRMQNLSATGAGRFTMYSDGASNYSTFTKYGSTYAGGYAGITTLYPLANLLAFGNNGLASGDGLGRFLISTAGNAGISLFKGGTSKLKFHADFTTENVGIGGNSAPVGRVHMNNTDGTTMDVCLTNNTTGHTATDGLDIRNTGNDASITNRENANLTFGTNNTPRMTVTSTGDVGVGVAAPGSKFHVNGTITTGDNATTEGTLTMLPSNGAAFFHMKNNNDNTLRISHGPVAGTADLLTIHTDGNVGIGNTNPQQRLDVSGKTILRDTLWVNSGTPNTQMIIQSDAGTSSIQLNRGTGGYYSMNMRTGFIGTTEFYTQLDGSGPENSRLVIGGDGENFVVPGSDNTMSLGVFSNKWSNVFTNNLTMTNGAGNGLVLTSDASGNASWAAPATSAITSSVGTNDYLPKFATGGTSLVNSLFRDNGTSVSCGNTTPSSASQLYVYREQITSNGDGQHSLFGYRDRNVQNDGTGYSQNTCNTATEGFNFWGDAYTFGIGGHNYNDYTRTGGVLGAQVFGSYWGSLGYRSSGSLNYGVYGSSAYASGGGFLPSNEVAGIGGGFFGNMVGSISKGKVIGQMNSGELFASYNLGDEYTSGKQIELVDNGNEKVAAYSVTSTELTIYKKGKATLVNGSVFIPFDNNYSSLLADIPVVTVSAMGLCNGLYIASVDKNGFTVKELNGGTSNVSISWISVGDRIDNHPESTIPQEVLSNQFDTNLQQVMYDDSKKDGSGQGMWWDGQTKNIKFGVAPASTSPAPKPEGTQE
ncbi:MAG TPA: hypothetical protein DCF33_10330, partial [Saprospirales bacterium]|nr:hypothetical protein [Saprospirales bacterium]